MLLSKTALIANEVVGTYWVLGWVIGRGVVVVVGVLGGVSGVGRRRRRPYRSQIGLRLGVGRSGGRRVTRGVLLRLGGEVEVEEKEVEVVGDGVVAVAEVEVGVIGVVGGFGWLIG